MNRLHINKHLSVRFQAIAKNYGLTTVGQLKTMLDRMPPTGKVSLPLTHMRAHTARKLLERELNSLFD